MPLNYRRGGVTYQINLYSSDNVYWEDSLKFRRSGSSVYGQMTEDLTHIDASHLRIRANGSTYTLLKEQDVGELWGFGFNPYGVLVTGDNVRRSSPVQIGSESYWRSISASYQTQSTLNSNAAAGGVKYDGTLWMWGGNNEGELGQGDRVDSSSPIQVGSLTDWRYVDSGYGSITAVKTDGTLWSWGDNNRGQLGHGDTVFRSSPVQVGSLTNWRYTVGTSDGSTLALKTDGTLWACGANAVGELAQGDTDRRSSPVQIGSDTDWSLLFGGYRTLASIKEDGTLWMWGRGISGELGQGSSVSYSSPVQVGSDTWEKVAMGNAFTIAVKSDGTLWGWGANNLGQLGQGDNTSRNSPVQVGGLTDWKNVGCINSGSIAIKTDGTLWAWGTNTNGELGLGDLISRSSPTQIGSDTSWIGISAKVWTFVKKEV